MDKATRIHGISQGGINDHKKQYKLIERRMMPLQDS